MVSLAISKDQRERLQEVVDQLITILDEIEGDADFEPDPDDEDGGDHEPDVRDLPPSPADTPSRKAPCVSSSYGSASAPCA